MNCIRCRSLCNRRLDGRESSPLLPEMVLHGRVCTTGAFALPALATWIVSPYLPPGWEFAARFLLVSGAMVSFAVTPLRPRFIS
jgi:hypothetical protein